MSTDRKPYLRRVGKTYGRWTVTGYAGKGMWECRCECGNSGTIWAGSLTKGASRSCGCLQAESRVTHGGSRGPEYNVWRSMIQRCHNPKNTSYHRYGGRGIRVADRWRGEDGFARFLADIGPRPSMKHTMDRHPDPAGNYEPGNVRWATIRQQQQNTRRNVNITFRGRAMCLQEWARELGVSCPTLSYRVKHWPLEKAMTTPPGRRPASAKPART